MNVFTVPDECVFTLIGCSIALDRLYTSAVTLSRPLLKPDYKIATNVVQHLEKKRERQGNVNASVCVLCRALKGPHSSKLNQMMILNRSITTDKRFQCTDKLHILWRVPNHDTLTHAALYSSLL